MRPGFPSGPVTRSAIYWLGFLAALKALSLILMGQSVASMLAGLTAADPDWADGLGWGMAGVVLRSATGWAQGVAARRAALGVKEELRSGLLARALRNGARATGPADGGLAILATRGLDALDNYYTQFLPALVNCAAIPLLLGARILFADWVSAVVIVLTVPLVPLFMILIGRYTEDNVQAAQATLSRLSAHMLELAKGLPVLVGLGRATAQRQALEEISEEYRSRTMGTLRTAFLSALALELIATISVAVVAVFIGVRLVHGEMPLEAGLLALILAPDCYLPLRELGTAHHASDDGRAALAETTAVSAAPEPRPLEDDGGSAVRAAAGGGVRVTGLTVTYAGRSAAAVGPLTFTAPPGRITALDGPSGTGKSTVLGALAGTIGDGAGTTVTGGLSGFDRDSVAWVPQHPVMVQSTVLDEVILYLAGAPGPAASDDAAARECLAAASAGHLAQKHPAELSPGELRRVALARGLARIRSGATVLLLDEPTAHLDSATAAQVEDAILALRGRITVILVAHDARTRALADRVVPVSAQGVTEASPPASGGSAVPETHHRAAVTEPAYPDNTPAVNDPAGYDPGDNDGTASGSPAGAPAASARTAGARTASGRTAHDQTAGARTPATGPLLARLLGPVAGRFAGAAAVGTLAALFAVALSGLSGWLIIRASEQPPILYLLTAIVGVRFFGIGRAVLRYGERLLVHDAVFAALTRLRGSLWESLSRRALSLRRLLQGGNVLGTMINDVDTIRDLLPRVVLPPVTAAAVAGSALAATALLVPAALPAVAAAAAASLLLAPAGALWADRKSATAEQGLRAGVLRRTAAALDARAELHANGVAATVLADLGADDRAATRASQRSAWAEGLGQGITTAACGSAAFATAIMAGPHVLDGSLPPATAAVIVLLQLALMEPYAATTTAVRQFPAFLTVMRRIGRSGALDGKPSAATAAAASGPASDGVVPVAARAGAAEGIELEGVAAAWPVGSPVFTGVSAAAGPGRWLAVTGPSGAGKSTLLSVLLGFLPPTAGHVRVTGRAAWCPQEAHLFDSTLRGNLLLGRPATEDPDTADGDIAAALAAVGLNGLVARLPAGLDTRIGPGGSFLSGGERQRLAVARTLMTGAEVILLDEPTAHLDAEAGRAMLADLRAGLSDRTVVLVTHNVADISAEDALLELSRPELSLSGVPSAAQRPGMVPAS